ncbi:hypothetical protein NP233_g3884 [Leucocoprinus birnbaumii]|uniref:Uncharacterized protein n=1 Tax=Leucocoprinus birnbaumii TaxID=56174 RepID=A0AAD5VYD7_9AGAR|nr:hypothetical protein NP233_g3884 [Leucocoprinus birnbaumii]
MPSAAVDSTERERILPSICNHALSIEDESGAFNPTPAAAVPLLLPLVAAVLPTLPAPAALPTLPALSPALTSSSLGLP